MLYLWSDIKQLFAGTHGVNTSMRKVTQRLPLLSVTIPQLTDAQRLRELLLIYPSSEGIGLMLSIRMKVISQRYVADYRAVSFLNVPA